MKDFFFNDTATTEIYTLSLHDALPIYSFYWYDYETFGTDPRVDRIAQFAGVRTDMDFNIIDKPVDIYCKAADDVLPDPEACLITGITPQKTLPTGDRKSTRLNSSHTDISRMPSSA